MCVYIYINIHTYILFFFSIRQCRCVGVYFLSLFSLSLSHTLSVFLLPFDSFFFIFHYFPFFRLWFFLFSPCFVYIHTHTFTNIGIYMYMYIFFSRILYVLLLLFSNNRRAKDIRSENSGNSRANECLDQSRSMRYFYFFLRFSSFLFFFFFNIRAESQNL